MLGLWWEVFDKLYNISFLRAFILLGLGMRHLISEGRWTTFLGCLVAAVAAIICMGGKEVVWWAAGGSAPARKRKFFGTVELPVATSIMNFGELYKEIIRHLTKDPTASVKLTLEIAAEFGNGAPEDIRRTVAENAAAFKLKAGEWE